MAGPGVEVTTETVSGPAPRQRAPGSTYIVAGLTERGPTDEAALIRSIAEYQRKLGDRVAYGALYDDLQAFFAEGGTRAYVCRVVGAGAAVATLTLQDAVPADTIRVDAANEGAWGNSLTVEVTAGTNAGEFTITISGTPDGDDEVFRDLEDVADAVATVNAGSRWVELTDLGAGTDPAVQGPTALAGGDDDRATVTAADYTDQLDALAVAALGAAAVAVPGQDETAVGAALITHAEANNRLALLAPAAGSTVAAAKSAANTLRQNNTNLEYAGLFYPHVVVPDGAGGTRTISPVGYVAGVRARAHEQEGPWRAPAGDLAKARYVKGLETEVTDAEGDELDAAFVSAIRPAPVRLYGWRSLSSDEANYFHLTGRDVLNVLVRLSLEVLEQYVFRTIDGKGQLYSEIQGELTGLVKPWADAGGLYALVDEEGEQQDPGYRVAVAEVNSPAVAAQNEVRARLSVRVSPVGQLISVTIAKVGVTAAL